MSKKISNSVFTLVVVGAILVVLNYIVGGLGFLNFRVDLTDRKIYTLSQGSKQVLDKLPDVPIKITFYATKDSRLMPQFIRSYTTVVQDLLLELEKESKGRITLEKVDPRPNTEEEDQAVADDIQGHVVNAEGDKAYLGLSIQSLDKKEIIPALNPQDEASLEYQIIRTVAKVTQTKRPVVGVLSPMPIATPAMHAPGFQSPLPPPWVVIEQLRQDYDVREVPYTSESIDKDINVLLIVHPADMPDLTEYAVDQFVLRGGKVVAFVDPDCKISQNYNRPGQLGSMPTTQISASSSLKRLFGAWGVKYDPSKIVADMSYRTMSGGRAQPTMLTIDRSSINQDEPITASLEMIQMLTTGAFSFEDKSNLKTEVLLESSSNASLISQDDADKSRTASLTNFQTDGNKQVLGFRLTGRFASAFPNGKPKAPEDPAKKEAPAEQEAKKEEEAKEEHLKESTTDGVVFVFGDADMEYDIFAFESDPSGQIIPMYRNSNIPLLLNTVELLTGGSELIEVRSRGVIRRPFTKMQDLRSQVEEQYRPLIEEKSQELNRVVQEIADLGGVKQKDGMVMLNMNQEQRRMLLEKQASIQKDIRNIQKDQNRKKEKLEMTITSLNLFGVPALIIVCGLLLAVRRRSLQAAK